MKIKLENLTLLKFVKVILFILLFLAIYDAIREPYDFFAGINDALSLFGK